MTPDPPPVAMGLRQAALQTAPMPLHTRSARRLRMQRSIARGRTASDARAASAGLRRLSFEPNVERRPRSVDIRKLIGNNLQLLLELVRRRPLPKLHRLYQRMRKATAKEVHGVHFDVRIAHGHQIRHRLKLELVLHLQKRMHLPSMAVSGEGGFECASRRDDLDLARRGRGTMGVNGSMAAAARRTGVAGSQSRCHCDDARGERERVRVCARASRRVQQHLGEILLQPRHAERGRVLYPAFGGVGYDEHLPRLPCVSQQRLHDPLE